MEREITDIFSGLKGKKNASQKHDEKETRVTKPQKKHNTKVGEKSNGKPGKFRQAARNAASGCSAFSNLHGVSAKLRSTSDGYKLYSEEDLFKDISKATGDTKLCPFECKCCF
ncbi:Protein of hypothetical protein function DUF1764 eukaryotic [Perkinsela sp. CCAP 1560/4]|nr:Protein of hypothetical protein function DUF1764 eukaryotic [Perkinsela sp. CCAP 1560/4]|eukprot:KNH06356.1 Protein of hypothetical protein function DUF1764 eukaryotic [Perkinsela sp. CCAP 1560/4]